MSGLPEEQGWKADYRTLAVVVVIVAVVAAAAAAAVVVVAVLVAGHSSTHFDSLKNPVLG